MKQILVISGKGGTGKTVVTGALAALMQNKVIADCDVDAANLHLLLHPETVETGGFQGMDKARIHKEKCRQCGACFSVCRFGAISRDFEVNPIHCEGCKCCWQVCPVGAIEMRRHTCGEWFVSRTRYGPFVHAKLGIAEENSGKLIAFIKEKAAALAEEHKSGYILIDGAPGIACPVIASLAQVDLALIVTEPTLSGRHDLERVLGLAAHFNVRPAVCVNKWDINEENTAAIRQFCAARGVPVLAEIPFDEEVARSVSAGIPFPVRAPRGPVRDILDALSKNILAELGRAP